MIDDFFKEVQESFLAEAEDLLAQSESLFLNLEKEADPTETLNSLKRLAHNFKGSGKAVGFDDLSKFSHKFENLLVALSSKSILIDAKVLDLLLESNDFLKNSVLLLKMDAKAIIDDSELVAKLESVIANPQVSNSNSMHSVNHELDKKPEKIDNIFENFQIQTPPEKNPNAEKNVAKVTAKTSDTDESIRVSLKKIDEILNSFGEQVILLNSLDHQKNNMIEHQTDIVQTIHSLKKLTLELQQTMLRLRMVNLKTLFSKLERAIRDAAKMTGKDVECIILGAENELDKSIVDQLGDPLIHMVRNSVDHGLEDNDIRVQNGKDRVGQVTLKARREGGSFIIEVQDNGKGLDVDRIYQKGIEKGLIKPDQDYTEKAIFNLIFENGFSTKESASELSGRGVGMNVVKGMIENLGGSCEITSKKNVGSIFLIKLPLSLSLFNGLLIDLNGETFVVPASQVQEIVNVNEVKTRIDPNVGEFIQLRELVIPVQNLHSYVRRSRSQNDDSGKIYLITNINNHHVAFKVSAIKHIQKIVQKPLNQELLICRGASGVTILGNGGPAIILDLRGIAVKILESMTPKEANL
ncbi:MAG: chemotaxis protein CheA [Bacteriovoracaceae bacterium]